MLDPGTLTELAAIIGAMTAVVAALIQFIRELERFFLAVANFLRVLFRRSG